MLPPDTQGALVRYEAAVATRWPRTLFMVLWSGMAVVMVGVLGYGLVTEPLRFPELWLVWCAVALAAVVGWGYVWWQLRGKEVLVLAPHALVVHNAGTLFRRRLVVQRHELEELLVDDDAATPFWIKDWGIGGGRLVIAHNGTRRRYGMDLDKARAERLAQAIREAWGA